jgi:antitoxin (DNA-binding transcriptional repressor) of toxin-antitoxin stability system
MPLASVATRSYTGFAMSSVLLLPPPTEGTADRLAEAAARAEHGKKRVVLIRDGKPVAAAVPIEDLEALEAEDEYWADTVSEAIAAWEAEDRPAFRLRISRAIRAST